MWKLVDFIIVEINAAVWGVFILILIGAVLGQRGRPQPPKLIDFNRRR